MQNPASSSRPEPRRTNSRSSVRSLTGRHVELSLVRMVSHEAHTLPERDEDDSEATADQKAVGTSGSDSRVILGKPTKDRNDRLDQLREGEDGGDHSILEKAEEALESSGERLAEGATGTLPSMPNSSISDHPPESDDTSHPADPDKTKSGKRKEIHLQDQTNLLPVKQVLIIFLGLSAALFCSLLDQTIVSTALPTLGRDFNAADISSWVGTAYLLTSTACQPMYGRFSDIFGRKVVLLVSLAIFMLGSVLCAVAQSMVQLIVFRAIQGMGGGGILTLVMIIVSDIVSLKDRGKYQGVLGGVVACANSIGPVLGGVFTVKLTWRWCFYINIPLSALAIVVVIFLLPLKRVNGDIREKLKKVDYMGSIVTFAAALLIILGLSWAGSQYAWSSAAVIAPLVIGVMLSIGFIILQWKVIALPIIPMHIFKNGTVAASMASTFLNGMIFYVNLYYLPQYYQVCKGATALRSGVLMLPLVLTQTVISFVSGVIVSRTGEYRYNLIAGYAIWTVAQGLLSTITQDTPTATLIGFQLLAGIGGGQTFQTSLVAIQAAVKRADMAVATGTRNFLRLLGGTIALAACSAILNNAVRSYLDGRGVDGALISAVIADPTSLGVIGLTVDDQAFAVEGYVKGIQAIYQFTIACAGASFFLVVLFVKHYSLTRKDDAALKVEGKEWAQAHKGGAFRKDKRGSQGDLESGWRKGGPCERRTGGHLNETDLRTLGNMEHIPIFSAGITLDCLKRPRFEHLARFDRSQPDVPIEIWAGRNGLPLFSRIWSAYADRAK